MTTTNHNITIEINPLSNEKCLFDAIFGASTRVLVECKAHWNYDKGCRSEGDYRDFTLRNVEITDVSIYVDILGQEIAVPFDVCDLNTEVGKVIEKHLLDECVERVADSEAPYHA